MNRLCLICKIYKVISIHHTRGEKKPFRHILFEWIKVSIKYMVRGGIFGSHGPSAAGSAICFILCDINPRLLIYSQTQS